MRVYRFVVMAWLGCMVQGADALGTVIAGSTLASPPPFMESSFRGLTPTIDWAYSLDVISGGPYFAEELQVAAYHYEGLAGDTAEFSIHLDEGGLPGAEIGSFMVDGISTTQQVLTATAVEMAVLDSDTGYWLVGSTSGGQVNWNLGVGAFGEYAKRVSDGEWQVFPYGNISAYAILGSPVPEPSCACLLGCSLVLLTLRGRGIAGRKCPASGRQIKTVPRWNCFERPWHRQEAVPPLAAVCGAARPTP